MDRSGSSHARLLSPDEIDNLDVDSAIEMSPAQSSRESTDHTSRLRDYEGRRSFADKSRSFTSTFSPKQLRHALTALVVVALIVIAAAVFWPRTRSIEITHWVQGTNPVPDSGTKTGYAWVKPKEFKIVGMVFYGRPMFVDILDCYLKRNLVSNGGYLDEVLFMENTDNQVDLAWLDGLMEHEPLYRKLKVGGGGAFDNIWQHAQANNTLYIKIDDDIVYVHDDAIPRMVDTLLKHPEAHNVAANIINSPLTDWLHYHTEAVYPYLPEVAAPPPKNFSTWRPSELPKYTGEIPEQYDFAPTNAKGRGVPFKVGEPGGPPYENHRWLPLQNTSENLMKTPIAKAEYASFGLALYSWAIAAQQQYSLFANIEHDTMDRYWTGNKDGIWNMQYQRYNLNFLAIWGSSVAMQLPGSDDEEDLTVTIPKALHRPTLVDTHALVAHFNFGPQPELKHTDLLDRYRAYANDMVCTSGNQKKELDLKYPPPPPPVQVRHSDINLIAVPGTDEHM